MESWLEIWKPHIFDVLIEIILNPWIVSCISSAFNKSIHFSSQMRMDGKKLGLTMRLNHPPIWWTSPVFLGKSLDPNPYHMLRVWYIYLHLGDLVRANVGNITAPWSIWDMIRARIEWHLHPGSQEWYSSNHRKSTMQLAVACTTLR